MIVSQARIEANRKNAQKSTGPRTLEGKLASRGNAIQHGLCSVVVVPESVELVQEQAEAIYRAFKPANEYHAYQVDRAAVLTVRIMRCERMERKARDKIALRAEVCWDDDRKLEAEVLGEKLATKPARIVESLRRSPHGCEWLMTRWALLAHAADTNPDHAWTDAQARLAFDLLATPLEFRLGRKPGAEIDLDGRIIDPADDSAAVARRMIAELKAQRERVQGLDEVDRALVEADLTLDADPELKLIRRYEADLHRKLKWALGQINHVWEGPNLTEEFFPRWLNKSNLTPEPKTADEVAAENHPANSPSPPFCLTPDEFPPPGQKADIPAILVSRKVKRMQKAEALREARRRKLDKLLA